MEAFGGFSILPTVPRDGGRGRRQVSPVWWSSDESSFAVSGLDERPPDDSAAEDEAGDWMIQRERSAQTKALNPSTTNHTSRAEPYPMSFSNRLRRQPAVVCLSAQYMESGGCSTRESREADAVQQQTIRPTVATQGTTEGTNHGARRSCQLSAHTNQPELVKVSSGTRRVSAQTFAAMLEAGVWEDRDAGAGQHDAHKDNDGSGTSTEDACTRSSIASAEAASTVFTGNVIAKIAPVQRSEAPKLSPQHAEFLNFHSNGERHESLRLPAKRALGTPHNHIEEQNNLSRLKSIMAKFDGKVKAHVKARQRPRRRAVMRPEVASRQAPIDRDARLAKISKSRQWREPPGQKEVPRRANTMLLRSEDIPTHLFPRGHRNYRGRLFEHPPPPSVSSPEARSPRRTLELGQAREVRISKPGKASVIKISTHESRSFDLRSLSPVETNLMLSAGTVAKSARRANTRSEGTRLRVARSSATDDAVKLESPIRVRQQSRIPRAARAVPATAEYSAHPFERPIGGSPNAMNRDARFPQLVRRLKTNDPASNDDACHASVQEVSRLVPSAAPASQQRSAVHPHAPNYRWTTGRIQSSLLKHRGGHLSLQGNLCQSRGFNEDYSTLPSLSKTQANRNPPAGNSGCPSLISDDGQEPFDFPEAVADEHARLTTFQAQPGTSAWGKEKEVRAALDETSPEGSPTLVRLSTNDSGLLSAADTEAIHDENIRADEIHAGVGTSSSSERGWLSVAPYPFASPRSMLHDRRNRHLHEQGRHGRRMKGARPDEPSLYGCCAILRWLISTSDAPGTPGMWHESSMGLELLMNDKEYRLRIDDEERAKMQRILNCLNEGIPLPPEPSDEASAFFRSMNMPPIP